ncbi:MAG: hypothetical protein HY869_10075 [Chloroflexi bacterium]|nr:hypothetical protein [Chloroflexota bacterium]
MSKEEITPIKRKRVNFTYFSFFALPALLAWWVLYLFLSLRSPEIVFLSPVLLCAGVVFGLLGIGHNLKTYPIYWTIPPIISTLLNTVLLIAIVTTINFSPSDYGTCRKTAMDTKGYGVWEHQQTTTQESGVAFIHYATVTFSDGTNDLSCEAVGVGPLWATSMAWQTLVACLGGVQNGSPTTCPLDYFGVYP